MESLEHNILFTVYKNNKLHKVDFQDLLENKRVLICSVVRPRENLAFQYVEHIIDQLPYYKSLGIDDVYIVNSIDGLYTLARWDKSYSNITGLYDEDGNLVKWLAKQQQKKTDIDTLRKYWSYQVLINNGQVEQFYEQPTDHHVKDIIESGYKLHLGNHKIFAVEKEQYAFHRPNLRMEEQRFEQVNIDERNLVTGAVFYYKLWPNYPLHDYLKSV